MSDTSTTENPTAQAPAETAPTDAAPAAIANPWIHHLTQGKAAMAERVAAGGELSFRTAEFWSEASWPLHTIDVDESLAKPSGEFLDRLAKQGLTPAMNVIVHRKSNHHVGATFGHHAYTLSFEYAQVEALRLGREQAIAEGKLPEIAEAKPVKSKEAKELEYAAAGAEIELSEKSTAPAVANKFAYLDYLDKKKFPVPNPVVEPEAWIDSGQQARDLCEKFGLRSVSVPLAFNASEASAFIQKLDSALGQLAEFMGVEPHLIGLDKWLGLRARSPGAMAPEEAQAMQGAASLAEKEKAAAEKTKEDAKKKKSDSEHGLFMGNFIQIEISHNFEPVVLAHEWFHSLDLWFGSRDIVAKQPWRGWNVFASRVAFSEYEQSDKLKEWASLLSEGGDAKPDFLSAIPENAFLSQMRFDTDMHPTGEFYKSMPDILAQRLIRSFGDLPMDAALRQQTEEQASKLGALITDAANTHALDHLNSAMSEESLSRRRKEFLVEWGDLACMWGRRQAGESADAQLIETMETKMKTEVLRVLSGAWNWTQLARMNEKPDVHMLQAMRMDAMGGSMNPYFSTPHEMLAYKLEELFLARGREMSPDDKVGTALISWIRDEAVPALREAREVSFNTLMGSKKPKM